jgi:hypothetical protein
MKAPEALNPTDSRGQKKHLTHHQLKITAGTLSLDRPAQQYRAMAACHRQGIAMNLSNTNKMTMASRASLPHMGLPFLAKQIVARIQTVTIPKSRILR